MRLQNKYYQTLDPPFTASTSQLLMTKKCLTFFYGDGPLPTSSFDVCLLHSVFLYPFHFVASKHMYGVG